jgi:hypothetical protein
VKRITDEKLDSLDAEHFQGTLDRWKSDVPEWKREGGDALDRHLADLRKRVEKAENDLKQKNHAAEARDMKEKFERWVDEVRK